MNARVCESMNQNQLIWERGQQQVPEQWHIYFKNLKVAGEFKKEEEKEEKEQERKGGGEKRSVSR